MFRTVILVLGIVLLLSRPTPGQTAGNTVPPLPPILAQWLNKSPEAFVKHFDKDGDGYLSKDEAPPFLRKSFAKVDLNGDGKLDAREVGVLFRAVRQRQAKGLVLKLPPADSAEVQEVLNRLLQLDRDKDGKISRAEARGRLADTFERLDLNRDGYLDRAELRRAAQLIVALRQAGPSAPKVQPAAPEALDFDALDSNADGRLTREEVHGTVLEALFDQVDTNRDGRIDPREFAAFLKKRQTPK
jgi:Ca2+-binding EF-hand superfamily protein